MCSDFQKRKQDRCPKLLICVPLEGAWAERTDQGQAGCRQSSQTFSSHRQGRNLKIIPNMHRKGIRGSSVAACGLSNFHSGGSLQLIRLYVFAQGAECGEGVQRRNLSCVVHWGDWPESPPQFVSADLCGERLVRSIQQEMDLPCFVPCPGQVFHKLASQTCLHLVCKVINYVFA